MGISVLELLEHSVPEVTLVCSLIRMTVSDPLEHSVLSVTFTWTCIPYGWCHGTPAGPLAVAIDLGWLSVVRFSRMPVLSDTGYVRSYGGLGRTCIIDWGVDSPG